MRNRSRWVSALALGATALLVHACGDDDPGGRLDGGGTGARDGGGQSAGGRSSTGGKTASGGADAAALPGSGSAPPGGGGDASVVDGDAEVPWPECPTTHVDAGAADGGALYPACEAPPLDAKHPIQAFPVGVYELEVHALHSFNTAEGAGCTYRQSAATVEITLAAHAPCCGDDCLMNPASELVVTVRSAEDGVALEGRAAVTAERPLRLAFSEQRRSYTLTVNRATGAVVMTGFQSVALGGGAGDANTYWEGRGSLACAGAPARSSPPAFPKQLPKTLACGKNLVEPEDWERPCRFDRVTSEGTCATTTLCQGDGGIRASCVDESPGYSMACCPE